MDIKAMRKEITELIDNIKLHSDELTEKPHIPQLELELIVSKIEKLYKKSIIFNFEYSHPQKTETEKIAEPVAEIKEQKPEVKTILQNKNFPNFKNLIGINQKFQFASELFGGNTNELNAATEKINSAENKDDALKIASELKVKFRWKEESSVVDDFIKLIVKKFS